MLRRRSASYMVFLLFSDLLLTEAALYIASIARRNIPLGMDLGPQRFVYLPSEVYVMVLGIWSFIFVLLSVYDRRQTLRIVDELQRVLLAVVMATLVLAGALYLSFRDVPRLLFVYFSILDLAFLIGFRLLLPLSPRIMGRTEGRTVRVLIVGRGALGEEMGKVVKQQAWNSMKLMGYLDDGPERNVKNVEGVPVLGRIDEAMKILRAYQIDEVVIALPLRQHRKLVDLVQELQRLPIDVRIVPDVLDLAFHRATVENLGGVPLIGLREPAIDGFQRLVKRAFDLIAACTLVVVSTPLMLLVAITIKLDSKGPVMFEQERVGENCRPFRMYKFRSMIQDGEAQASGVVAKTEEGQIVHKLKDDPRITRVGRILRRTSLDELPQLFNVIKGEMSLVGPRPELPFLVERYEPWQRKRFAVPPGITGWWQVSGRSDKLMHLHVEDDLYYIQNYSLLLDLKILWKTIGAVLERRGAY